jgi:hypothetical protein
MRDVHVSTGSHQLANVAVVKTSKHGEKWAAPVRILVQAVRHDLRDAPPFGTAITLHPSLVLATLPLSRCAGHQAFLMVAHAALLQARVPTPALH